MEAVNGAERHAMRWALRDSRQWAAESPAVPPGRPSPVCRPMSAVDLSFGSGVSSPLVELMYAAGMAERPAPPASRRENSRSAAALDPARRGRPDRVPDAEAQPTRPLRPTKARNSKPRSTATRSTMALVTFSSSATACASSMMASGRCNATRPIRACAPTLRRRPGPPPVGVMVRRLRPGTPLLRCKSGLLVKNWVKSAEIGQETAENRVLTWKSTAGGAKRSGCSGSKVGYSINPGGLTVGQPFQHPSKLRTTKMRMFYWRTWMLWEGA